MKKAIKLNKAQPEDSGGKELMVSQRLNMIVELVRTQGSVTMQELQDLFPGVSPSTIARDLSKLHNQSHVKKVHGGAVWSEEFRKPPRNAQAKNINLLTEYKDRIALYACNLISMHDFVFLDGGSTTLAIARLFKPNGARFATNSPNHARLLADAGSPVTLIGGTYSHDRGITIGEEALLQIQQYQFTKSFMGASGFAIHTGFTTTEMGIGRIKHQVISKSTQAYVVADSSKVDRIECITFARLDQATIITNRALNETYAAFAKVKVCP